MSAKHRRRPKVQHVRKYPRWVGGYRKRVGSHLRGDAPPKIPKRCDERQLTLDLRWTS